MAPLVFRDAKYHAKVFIGKRTVKEGECAGIWDMSGEYRVIEGPKREWMAFSRVRFMNRHIADCNQYLKIQYRSGTIEHRRGPIALFEDPVKHERISVLDAVHVDAFEVIVVYTEDAKGTVARSIIKGPTVFIPEVNQWIHQFSWHGADPSNPERKVPGALRFTKLRTIADQFYYSAPDVRTSDDAKLTVKVMLFFILEDLEKMLNSTHDPIGDFINALLADLMNFGSRNTYESFIQSSTALSELETFPVLKQRAAAVGFKLNKVVYRGYTATGMMQQMHDNAVSTRTRLKLQAEEQETAQSLRDMELHRSTARGAAERDEEKLRQAHRLQLQAAENRERLKVAEEEHALRLRQQREERELALETQKLADKMQVEFLESLRTMGVSMTDFLVACQTKGRADQVVQVVTGAGAGGQEGGEGAGGAAASGGRGGLGAVPRRMPALALNLGTS
uniref:Band 7 domain-containing protein n=1 Tax=Chlamydomonas chlamydogama TaxID=225041 RepID=A0A7S2QU90_9CHLO|mmetsp:Transcript_427/g.870  ORF Transcript_427/g.870 Transcript_427/m.870 type:complete len:450 (+) Transcript_427:264-1613(+)